MGTRGIRGDQAGSRLNQSLDLRTGENKGDRPMSLVTEDAPWGQLMAAIFQPRIAGEADDGFQATVSLSHGGSLTCPFDDGVGAHMCLASLACLTGKVV